MSRIGLSPVVIPQGVKFIITDKNEVTVEGTKGKLVQKFNEEMKITQEDNIVNVARPNDNNYYKSLHGLTQKLISNMVTGVSDGFQKKLEIKGVGFRAQLSGRTLTIQLGYSHPVVYEIPAGIEIILENPTTIIVSGIDKQQVGQVTSTIRGFRPPDPYKQKGIRIEGEFLRKKAGKSGKK